MEASQETLREELASELEALLPSEQAVPVVGLLGFNSQPNLSEDELLNRLIILTAELDMQRRLLDNLESYRGRMGSYLSNYPTIWPIRGQISSGFGWRRNPMSGRGSEHHNGIDIPASTGTPIRAAGGGTVTFSGWNGGYGNTVIIDHGGGLTTMYSHNTRNSAVVGQVVERGEIIAYVGSTGRSTGPHLHYEIRRNGTAVNPISFLLEHHN
jgi:murein DD-endopeptidase MepM/ murein hydrolase activator NlpD